MLFEKPETPTCVKVANLLRIAQFIAKLVLYWWIFIDALDSVAGTLFTVQMICCIPVFLWYEFWRIGYLIKRIKMYILQWSLAVFDMTAFSILKCLVLSMAFSVSSYQGYYTFYKVLSIIYIVYLILPFIIFTSWLIAYCKARQASKGMAGGLAGAAVAMLADRVSIQFMAIGSSKFRIFVIINAIVGFLLAAAVTGFSFDNFSAIGLTPGNKIYLIYLFEIIDIGLNFLEDRVLCYYATRDPGAIMSAEPPIPGLGCCSCGAFGGLEVQGGSIPLI